MGNQKAYNSYRGNNNFTPPCNNKQEWIEWLRLNPRDLRRLPESLYSDDLFLSIVKHNGFAIGGIPFEYLTPRILITAIKRDPMALNSVPESLRTISLCKIALEGDLKAIRLVPDEFLHFFIENVLSIDGQQCRSIIPKLSIELLELSVLTTPNAIQYIPSELITETMVENAINKDGEILQYIPSKFLNEKVILKALETDRFGFVFECIPDEFKEKFISFRKEFNF